jgi:AraC-like DNA-binding protein
MGNSPLQLAGIRFSLPARRESTYFVWKFIAPLTLVVCMAWLVQWIDPSMAPSRIGLSATALLTVFAYQFSVASSLPRVSYTTRMDRFFLGAIGIVLLGMVLSVISSELFRRERHEDARRLTRQGRWLLPTIYAIVAAAAFAI